MKLLFLALALVFSVTLAAPAILTSVINDQQTSPTPAATTLIKRQDYNPDRYQITCNCTALNSENYSKAYDSFMAQVRHDAVSPVANSPAPAEAKSLNPTQNYFSIYGDVVVFWCPGPNEHGMYLDLVEMHFWALNSACGKNRAGAAGFAGIRALGVAQYVKGMSLCDRIWDKKGWVKC